MSNAARKFMDSMADQDRMARLNEVGSATSGPQEGDLTRAKRALWAAEQRFRNILRRNAQVRYNSSRLDEVVNEAYQGLAACRAFYEGK
jgi:hypothetical protein